jgi:hypothetical protein
MEEDIAWRKYWQDLHKKEQRFRKNIIHLNPYRKKYNKTTSENKN